MPKYKFPLENQDDYKGVIYFTQLIEIPPTIKTDAFQRQMDNEGGGGTDIRDLGDIFFSSLQSGSVTTGETVQLYLPAAIAVQDGVEFDNTFSFGIAGEAARQSLSRGSGSVLGGALSSALGTGGIGSILSNLNSPDIARVAAAGAAKKLGSTAGGVVSSATGTVVNPNIRAVFKSVRPREHSFSFKFLPRSQREAREIGDIVDWFRQEIYPEPIKVVAGGRSLPVGYKFPNKMGIRMRYGNKDIGAQLLPAYIQSMNTNYNATTMSFYRDGEFSEIDLTLNLVEFRTLDKDDIKHGFNVYGKNFKDLYEEFFNSLTNDAEGPP